MTVWFVNRQLGFVWRGWTKRAACPQGGRRQPDSLIWAAWDSGRRDPDWPKSTPQLHYSLSILCLPASPRCLSFPLYSDYRVYVLLAAWVRESDNRKRQSCCISTFTPLPLPPCIQERDKFYMSRIVVLELLQALKFKSPLPDTNLLLLVQVKAKAKTKQLALVNCA